VIDVAERTGDYGIVARRVDRVGDTGVVGVSTYLFFLGCAIPLPL